MPPSKKKILKDLDYLAAVHKRSYESCKATAVDASQPPATRQGALYMARNALDKHRDYTNLAEQLRTGLIDRFDDNFLDMYR